MHLSDLVNGVAMAGWELRAGQAARAPDPDITAVVHDTRNVRPGALFCCVRGSQVDGHDLAPDAVRAGAVALVVERPVEVAPEVPQLTVPDVRRAMGPLADTFWGHPSQDLSVFGVTGTAGKTTVTHLLQSVMEAAGQPCGLVGTLSGARTTPEATELQAQLAAERDAGRQAVAMEVSSHGLELHRVDATRFEVVVFTNLSRDHLDFHHTMDAYFAAKARLFSPEFTHRGVVCTDDSWGRQLLDQLQGSGLELHPYSIADATDLRLSPHGAEFGWRGQTIDLTIPGRFNVSNALAAATAASAIGVDPSAIASGLKAAEPVPGRFEPIDAGQPFGVLVDYSHKPGALHHALLAARELVAPGAALRVVFGCGGDRDATKRPVMGEVAANDADRVVITSDNPRSEEPNVIIDEVLAGVPADRADHVVVEPDRRSAIALALDEAGPGDVVILAGKGNEATQTIGDRVLEFDDRVVARELLAEQGHAGAVR